MSERMRFFIDTRGQVEFRAAPTLYTVTGDLATEDSQGPMFNHAGQMLSYARAVGEVPDCTPAPKDKTWVEEQQKYPGDTTELYLTVMQDYIEGKYQGTFKLWSQLWDRVKIEAGIGSPKYPGTA